MPGGSMQTGEVRGVKVVGVKAVVEHLGTAQIVEEVTPAEEVASLAVGEESKVLIRVELEDPVSGSNI